MKKSSKIALFIASLVIVVILIYLLGFIKNEAVFSSWDSLTGENLYHYAINPPSGGGCSGVLSWVSNGDYIFNKESSIVLGSSTYSFVVNNMFRTERQPGYLCAPMLYDIDVFKNGIKIDSINSSNAVARAKLLNTCNSNPLIYRAYDDSGNVYSNGVDFINSSKVELANEKTGLVVSFGIMTGPDGARTDCRQFHMVNEIAVQVGKSKILPVIKQITLSNSSMNINLDIQNNFAVSESIIDIVLVSGIGSGEQVVYTMNQTLANGLNSYQISIPVSTDNSAFYIYPKVSLIASTSTLKNLNGADIFLDKSLKVNSQDHSKYFIEAFSGNRTKVQILAGFTGIDEDITTLLIMLNATLAEKAELLNSLNLSITEQAALISKLNLSISDNAVLIKSMNLQIDEQIELIKDLNLRVADNVKLISSLQLNIEDQANTINSLTSNLAEKAYYVSQLQVENSRQAELINEMKLSFSNQKGIIENLNLTIQGDSVLISHLNLTISQQIDLISSLTSNLTEQSIIIKQLNSTVDGQLQLITQLTSNLEEQKILVSQVTTLNANDAQTIAKLQQLNSELAQKNKSLNTLTYVLIGVGIILIITFIIVKTTKRRRR